MAETVSLPPVSDDAPLLQAYRNHAETVLNLLSSKLGDGTAAALTVEKLAAMDPQHQDSAGELATRYKAEQKQAEHYRTELNDFDVKVADIAAKSAQVVDVTRSQISRLVTVISGILAGVPPKPPLLDQLKAISDIDEALGTAEKAVADAYAQQVAHAGDVPAAGAQGGSSGAGGGSGGGYMPSFSGFNNPSSDPQSQHSRSPRRPVGAQPVSVSSDHARGQAASPRDVYNRLVTKYGLTPEQAAGILGNISQESGFDTGAVGDGGAAFGLCQWRDGRRAGLEQFAAAQHKPVTEWEVQVDYMMSELGSGEGGAWSHLQSARTPEDAAAKFDQYYERSSGAVRPQRMADAGAFFKMMGAVSV